MNSNKQGFDRNILRENTYNGFHTKELVLRVPADIVFAHDSPSKEISKLCGHNFMKYTQLYEIHSEKDIVLEISSAAYIRQQPRYATIVTER